MHSILGRFLLLHWGTLRYKEVLCALVFRVTTISKADPDNMGLGVTLWVFVVSTQMRHRQQTNL